VAGGADKVQASMNAKVNLVDTPRLLLLEHIGFVLVVEELDDWHPGVAVVHVVAETRGIDNRQAHYGNESDMRASSPGSGGATVCRTFEEFLLEFGFRNLDLDGLVHLLLMPLLVVRIVFDGGGEEGVDERGLAQSGFACHLYMPSAMAQMALQSSGTVP
jgi:hypothetical protein